MNIMVRSLDDAGLYRSFLSSPQFFPKNHYLIQYTIIFLFQINNIYVKSRLEEKR